MNKYLVKILATVGSTVAMWFIATGCMGPTINSTTDRSTVPISYGSVVEGIRIVASDGSFELKPGAQFNSPFQTDLWNCPGLTLERILESYDTALRCGAKRVKVYVGDDPEPLNGVLALNMAIRAATGPASRSYVIRVAPDKITSARMGNTSVSYERMDWKDSWTIDGSPRSSNKWWFGSVLWLSKYPL